MLNCSFSTIKFTVLIAVFFSACTTFDATRGKMEIDLKSFKGDVEYSNFSRVREKQELVKIMYLTTSHAKDLCNYPPTFVPEKVYFSENINSKREDTIEFILNGRAKNGFGVEDAVLFSGDIVRDGSFFRVVKY